MGAVWAIGGPGDPFPVASPGGDQEDLWGGPSPLEFSRFIRNVPANCTRNEAMALALDHLAPTASPFLRGIYRNRFSAVLEGMRINALQSLVGAARGDTLGTSTFYAEWQ